ncbi:hypothetical protein VJ918_05245 [Adlercreutzia sp. R21]|uniref:Uncharacterized protein n=1 Tax=Adlercreutzia wanghongyangiae TaxID=3111451 RepID=A0ABU6IF21_9ACTN|nr:hypothetical protein [Adlercreutzia sp. R21]MEC4175038.1 hypothetical protein [Adlercreutzia sp. R7]MEC4184212.1 hypothetical protein [Adlercreutzia sp. R21]
MGDVSQGKSEVADKLLVESRERRYDLFFPRSLSWFTRVRLWLRGYFDAARGKVWVARAGHIDSAFCLSLVEQADLRINAEWQEANGLMFELRPALEEAVRKRGEIIRRIDNLPNLKALKDNAAQSIHEGDELVSSHLAERRRKRRSSLVAWEFAGREVVLREALNEASAQAGIVLSQYQDVMDASMTHERLVRIDFLARLSCYARGVSRRMSVETRFVNDKALTKTPREDNERFFAACIRGMENEPKTDLIHGGVAPVPDAERAGSGTDTDCNADSGE